MSLASGASEAGAALQLGAAISGGAMERWSGGTLDEVFWAAAARHSSRVAVRECDGSSTTYAGLASHAAQVAARLRANGVRPGDRVALLLSAGAGALASIFGVLRCGAAYVPLDPSDPPSRLDHILADSGPEEMITDADNLELARRIFPRESRIINVSEQAHAGDVPESCRRMDSIAYVLYTSGSTGRPKGVMQTDRNVLHFAGAYSSRLGITPDDRLSFLFSMSFSASNMHLYGGLLNGAEVCPFDVRGRGVAAIPGWLRERGITVLHCVPSLLRAVGGHLSPGSSFPSLRAADVGGEQVFASDAALFRERLSPDASFVNHLAATEASVIAQHTVSPRDIAAGGAPPAGRPAPGMLIRIVRGDGSEARAGETGRITLRSPFLSPGYFGLDDLTATAFSPDPERPGWRIFRTGDTGWLDECGLLHVAGRSDGRVKIRGHSVHPAEAEAALCAIPGVTGAVVVPITSESPNAELHLAAYYTGGEIPTHELRRLLSGRIPSYMVPTEFNHLQSLPMTGTGKVDRARLCGPDRPRSARAEDFIEPANRIEVKVAELFGNVLGVERVGRTGNFFDLGGTSLKIASLQLELQRAFGHSVPLGDFLRDPTVRGIAELIKELKNSARIVPVVSPCLVAIRGEGARPPLFLVHGAYGQAFVSPAFVDLLGPDQPLYGFQARGNCGTVPPRSTITEMAGDYIEAMRRVRPEGPYLIGGICVGTVIAQEMACQLARGGAALAPLLLIDPQTPRRLDLSPAGRAMEMAVLQLSRLGIEIGPAGEIAREIRSSLRKHGRRGRIAYDHKDLARRRAAVRVAVTLRIALLRHNPSAYAGAAHILANRRWIEDDRRRGIWMRHITGGVSVHPAGEVHHEVLNPGNEIFAASLREALRDIHARLI